jgi:hypothetical protein
VNPIDHGMVFLPPSNAGHDPRRSRRRLHALDTN